jgi:hypothetical protein
VGEGLGLGVRGELPLKAGEVVHIALTLALTLALAPDP